MKNWVFSYLMSIYLPHTEGKPQKTGALFTQVTIILPTSTVVTDEQQVLGRCFLSIYSVLGHEVRIRIQQLKILKK